MLCDLCGSEKNLREAMIEGSLMTVCQDCVRYGKAIKKVELKKQEPRKFVAKTSKSVIKSGRTSVVEDFEEVLCRGFGKKTKNARESAGMKQEKLAKKLNMKVSLLQKIETEHFEPRLETARKIEKFFNIKLIQKDRMKGNVFNPNDYEEPATVGSMINIKTRKK